MTRLVEVAATLLGLVVRAIWMVLRVVPQIVGLGLIVYGVWMYDYRPALMALGAFVLLVFSPSTRPKDRRD